MVVTTLKSVDGKQFTARAHALLTADQIRAW